MPVCPPGEPGPQVDSVPPHGHGPPAVAHQVETGGSGGESEEREEEKADHFGRWILVGYDTLMLNIEIIPTYIPIFSHTSVSLEQCPHKCPLIKSLQFHENITLLL